MNIWVEKYFFAPPPPINGVEMKKAAFIRGIQEWRLKIAILAIQEDGTVAGIIYFQDEISSTNCWSIYEMWTPFAFRLLGRTSLSEDVADCWT